MKIILIGFMGSGKSIVARKLGELLKLPVVEMDELVFQKTKTTNMHEVFEKGGELLLRETEIAIAQEYALADNIIISTGGGVVLNKVILDYLKGRNGKIFFLNASFKAIMDRITDDTTRPLFKNIIEARSLFDFRHHLYLKYADEVLQVDKKTVEDIAQEVSKSYGE